MLDPRHLESLRAPMPPWAPGCRPGLRPEDFFTGAGGISLSAVYSAASGADTAAAGSPATTASPSSSSAPDSRRSSHGGRLPDGRELFREFWFSRSRASFRSSTTLRNTQRAAASGTLSSHASSIWRQL